MKRIWLLFKTLFNRKWWWVTLVVIAGVALLVRLGIWQLDRLEQRRAQNAQLVQALEAPPFDLAEAPLPRDLEALKDRKVMVRGQFDFERQMALKLQNWRGQAGVHLITPLLIEGRDTAVLVDRGWIPEAEAAATNWSQFDEPGTVTVNGYGALPQTLSQSSGNETNSGPQREWYRVDVAAMEEQLPYELLPIYALQAPEGDNTVLPFRNEPEFDLSEGPHLGYAIQWFAFSLMLAVGYVVYVSKNAPSLVEA
jgi:surfeit locus 1 family protein